MAMIDPFLEIYKSSEGGDYVLVHKTEVRLHVIKFVLFLFFYDRNSFKKHNKFICNIA